MHLGKGYSTAISSLEKGGEWQRALSLFGTMAHSLLQPNVICNSAMLQDFFEDIIVICDLRKVLTWQV